jgi:hypothetical protein
MAIVTSKFRTQAASSFAQRFGTDSMYLILSRPQSWDNALSNRFSNQGNGAISDVNVPNPADNLVNEYSMWREAMAAVKLTAADVKVCAVRNNWSTGTRYDMYRHDISSSRPTSTGKFSLGDSNMIVYEADSGRVYKCLFNGSGGIFTTGVVSTVRPTTLSTEPQVTGDGYIWKYLFTVPAGEADFLTANYIPVPTTSSVGSINGIDVIVVDDAGAGFTSNPTVNIYGDGTGASAVAVTSGAAVVRIDMVSPGQGYTWAKIVITGGVPTDNAAATAIIAPVGGHGASLQAECNAHNVMIAGTVSGYQASDVPVSQDFRIVSVVRNPSVYTTSTVTAAGTIATANTARLLRTLVMTSTATTPPAVDATIAAASGAQGIFVFQSSTTTNLEFIQPVISESSVLTSSELVRVDAAGTKQLYQFLDTDTVTTTAGYSQAVSSNSTRLPEIQPYSGEMLYLDYRQPVSRNPNQNEKINIVINF